jgi:hypothetical protein
MVNYNPYCWVMCSPNSELLGDFKFLGFEAPYENKQDGQQQDRQCTYVTSRRIRATVIVVEMQ